MPRTRRVVLTILTAASLASVAGCHAFATQKPGGRGTSIDQHTYASTAFEPKTVRLIDTRTHEELWSVDVPVDYKVVVKFFEDQSRDNVDNPDVMRWELMPSDSWGSLLDNQLPVPSKHARRLEFELRSAPEYAPEPTPEALDLRPGTRKPLRDNVGG